MNARAVGGALSLAALVGGCVTGTGADPGNDFMTRAHKANEYRWIADVTADGGTAECGKFFQRATVRIKDNVLTIWPYTGYQGQEYDLDLKGISPDGSGRVESSFAEDQTAAGQPIMHKTTFHLDPGVGPRRMIQHSNYFDRCSWTWTPEPYEPTGPITPQGPGRKPATAPGTTPTTVYEAPTTGRGQ
jgi:hypothetical protein